MFDIGVVVGSRGRGRYLKRNHVSHGRRRLLADPHADVVAPARRRVHGADAGIAAERRFGDVLVSAVNAVQYLKVLMPLDQLAGTRRCHIDGISVDDFDRAVGVSDGQPYKAVVGSRFDDQEAADDVAVITGLFDHAPQLAQGRNPCILVSRLGARFGGEKEQRFGHAAVFPHLHENRPAGIRPDGNHETVADLHR